MRFKNQNGFAGLELIIIVGVLAIIGAVGFRYYQAHKTIKVTSIPVTHKPKPKQPTMGTITGNASYPADGLPPDEQVCAVRVTGGSPVCVNVGNSGKLAYSLSVQAGDYYVYSTAESHLSAYKAYYDEYSKCGNLASCPASGHTAYISVKVTAGQTVTSVDPGDWYNQ